MPLNLKGIILVAMSGLLLSLLAGCSSTLDEDQVCVGRRDSCHVKPEDEVVVRPLPPPQQVEEVTPPPAEGKAIAKDP